MSISTLLDTLPVELVDKIMDAKKTLEYQDELNNLRRLVDHTDLPLLDEFPHMTHMQRIQIDNEYLNMFREHHFLVTYKHACETVIQTLSNRASFPEMNVYDIDVLKACVDERIHQVCSVLTHKFGIAHEMEAEIVARRMVKKEITNARADKLRRVFMKYTALFKHQQFQLRYFNA